MPMETLTPDEFITLYRWTCDMEEKTILWVMEFWPLFCPICGKAVHLQLSTHHTMGFPFPTRIE